MNLKLPSDPTLAAQVARWWPDHEDAARRLVAADQERRRVAQAEWDAQHPRAAKMRADANLRAAEAMRRILTSDKQVRP